MPRTRCGAAAVVAPCTIDVTKLTCSRCIQLVGSDLAKREANYASAVRENAEREAKTP